MAIAQIFNCVTLCYFILCNSFLMDEIHPFYHVYFNWGCFASIGSIYHYRLLLSLILSSFFLYLLKLPFLSLMFMLSCLVILIFILSVFLFSEVCLPFVILLPSIFFRYVYCISRDQEYKS